jgi:hypothetical protein
MHVHVGKERNAEKAQVRKERFRENLRKFKTRDKDHLYFMIRI